MPPIPTSSPLQLKKVVFHRFEVAANDKVSDNAQINIVTERSYASAEKNDLLWKVGLNVTFGEKSDGASPYFGSVNLEGVFEINETYPPDKRLDLISITGASILYGSAREMVANFSARGVHGTFLMPSVSFFKMDKAAALPGPVKQLTEKGAPVDSPLKRIKKSK